MSNEFPRPQSKSETASGEPTTQEQIAELIRRLEAGDVSLDHVSTTEDLVCNGVDAMRILSIRPEIFLERIWAGRVTSSLSVSGELAGHLYVSGIVDMDIKVSGALSGDLYTFGSGCVVGSILVRGTVGGDLQVIDSSEVRGGIGIVNSGFVAGNVAVKHSGCVGKSVVVEGATGKSLSVADSGSVLGDVFMTTHSSVGEHLSITTDGSIGNLVVAGAATVGDTLYVADTVRVDGVLSLGGSVVGVTTLSCDAQVISMRTSFQSSAFLGEGISLASCDFRGFTEFDKLRFVGSRPFEVVGSRRQQLTFTRPDGTPHGTKFAEQSAIHRQLRHTFERNSNRPAASDFYYSETEARRNALGERRGARKVIESEWLLLSAYKALSAYGTRSLRAIGWFGVTAVVATVLFALGGVDLTGSYEVDESGFFGEGWSSSGRWDLLQFTVRSMVSFLSPPQANLSNIEGWIQMALRFVGPLLIAQAVIAVRDRVAR